MIKPDQRPLLDDDAPSSKRRIVGKLLGGIFGLLLFVLACWIVVRQQDTLQSSLEAMRQAHWGWIALLLALPLGNVVFTSATFNVLTNRFGRVPLWEMHLLMLSAGLLNYLPLRPGLIGRVAYHRQIHGIRAIDSAKVVLSAIACSAIGIAGMLLGALAAVALGQSNTIIGVLLAIAVGVCCLITAGVLRAGGGSERWWRFLAACGFRSGDMLLWAARYAVAFRLVGVPIGWLEATVLATISQAALMVPLVGNGLGLREWAIGLGSGSGLLGQGTTQGQTVGDLAATGLTADLVNRAAEIVVLVPLGVIAGLVLAQKAQKAQKAHKAVNGSRERQSVEPPADPSDTQ